MSACIVKAKRWLDPFVGITRIRFSGIAPTTL